MPSDTNELSFNLLLYEYTFFLCKYAIRTQRYLNIYQFQSKPYIAIIFRAVLGAPLTMWITNKISFYMDPLSMLILQDLLDA